MRAWPAFQLSGSRRSLRHRARGIQLARSCPDRVPVFYMSQDAALCFGVFWCVANCGLKNTGSAVYGAPRETCINRTKPPETAGGEVRILSPRPDSAKSDLFHSRKCLRGCNSPACLLLWWGGAVSLSVSVSHTIYSVCETVRLKGLGDCESQSETLQHSDSNGDCTNEGAAAAAGQGFRPCASRTHLFRIDGSPVWHCWHFGAIAIGSYPY